MGGGNSYFSDGGTDSLTGSGTSGSSGGKKIFITSSIYDGNIGGIVGVDARCMEDSNYPGSGTYKALLVDGTNRRACSTANCSGGIGENIDWVLKPNTTYYRSDGITKIGTTDASGIFNFNLGNLDNSFSSSGYLYWTGLMTNWTTNTATCSNWTSNAPGETGEGGIGNSTNSSSIREFIPAGLGDCNNITQYFRPQLLCVEQ